MLQYCYHPEFLYTPYNISNYTYILPWYEIFYCLLIELLVLCYQPSCHNCSDVTILKFAATKMLLQR
jgi:hypothetical protein